MAPDPSPKLGVKSELVDSVIPVLFPAVTGPSLSPVRVTTTIVDAATTAVAVVTTIAVADGAAEVPLTDPLINTLGVAKLLKKPGGYVNVMELPMASAPPAVVVKLKVAVTFVLPAIRSDSFIKNAPRHTRPSIAPDALLILSQRMRAVHKDHTDTGVYRSIPVPSPTCASEYNRRQPQTRLPPHNATAPSKANI
jgi:hypothetical protein